MPATGAAFAKSVTLSPLSKTAAAPIPLPMHMLTTPKRADVPLFFISLKSVAVQRAPVADVQARHGQRRAPGRREARVRQLQHLLRRPAHTRVV